MIMERLIKFVLEAVLNFNIFISEYVENYGCAESLEMSEVSGARLKFLKWLKFKHFCLEIQSIAFNLHFKSYQEPIIFKWNAKK